MMEIEEMAKKVEEQNRHKEVVKALDWGVKYITSLLRPYEMEIKRHLETNPATISIAVYWKDPEKPKESEVIGPVEREEGLEEGEVLKA